MKKIVNQFDEKQEDHRKKAVLRLELDYQLAVLYEAMGESNRDKVDECKRKLETIRRELMQLKAL